jgi:predicted Zn finger-like uncharacterized protein
MLIACPQCATSYDISTAALGSEGRPVRCTRCRTVWHASAPEPALEMAGPADMDAMQEPEQPSELPPAIPGEAEIQPDAAEPDDMAAAMAADLPEAGSENPDPATTEMIDGAPPLVPQHEHHFVPGEGPFPMTGGDPAAFERRRAVKRAKQQRAWSLPKFRWPLAPLPTLLLALGAMVIILVGWRADVVRLLPQTASFYSVIGLGVNLRGLEFENIKTSREIHDGVPVMVVEGEIVSVARKAVDVPRLRFGVRNGLGAEIYNWTAMPSRTTAAPGDRVAFRSRLASPPAETHDISVRFYNRRDTSAGAR